MFCITRTLINYIGARGKRENVLIYESIFHFRAFGDRERQCAKDLKADL